MGNSRQGQHQTVKTASSTKTASKQETTMLREEPQELLSNQTLGRVLQAQRRSPQVSSSMPMDTIQRQSVHSSGFRGLSQELARGGSQGLVVQPKLKLTKAGDRHEQEADLVADQVVKRINTDPIRKTEATDGKRIMPKAATPTAPTGTAVTPQFETTLQQQRGQGQTIPEDVREPLEEAFHADFRHVRVHTNEQSHQLNHSIQAIAFTTGTDIFFKQGAYQPRSRQGQELLAHELTHVVQQNSQKTAIQRKEATTSNQSLAKKADTTALAGLVKEVSQEIKAFSAEWLESQPNQIEIFPSCNLTVKSLGFNKNNNSTLEIEGGLALILGSDITAFKSTGELKISYDFQAKKWDYQTQNIKLTLDVADIFTLDVQQIKYNREEKSLAIAELTPTIKAAPLKGSTAKMTKIKVDNTGVAWENLDFTIDVANIFTLDAKKVQHDRNAQALTIAELTPTIKAEPLKGSTAKMTKIKVDNTGVAWENLDFTIDVANIFTLDAKKVQHDRNAQALTIAELTPTIKAEPLKGSTAKMTKIKVDNTGVAWENLDFTIDVANIFTLDAKKVQHDRNAQALTIAELTPTIKAEPLKGSTAKMTKIKVDNTGVAWENLDFTIDVANIFTLDAKKVQHDRNAQALTIAELTPTIKAEPLKGSTAKMTKIKVDNTGVAWENLDFTIDVANIFTLDAKKVQHDRNAQALTIAELTPTIKAEPLKGSTAKMTKIKVDNTGVAWENLDFTIDVANIFTLDAKKVQHDRNAQALTIAELTPTIKAEPLKGSTAKMTKIKVDNTGVAWENLDFTIDVANIFTLDAKKVQHDRNAQALTIAELTPTIKAEPLKGSTAKMTKIKVDNTGVAWENLDFTIDVANIFTLDAKKVQHDRNAQALTIAELTPTIKAEPLKGSTAKMTKIKVDNTGVAWENLDFTIDVANIFTLDAKKVQHDRNAQALTIAELTPTIKAEPLKGSTAKMTKIKVDNTGVAWENLDFTIDVANIFTLDAKKVQHDRNAQALSVDLAKLKLTVPMLNKAQVEVANAKIDKEGLEWGKATAKIGDINIGTVLAIKNPELAVEGKKSGYSTTASGGVGLHFGEYLNAEGSGKIKLDRSQGSGEGKIRVEEAKLAVKGGITLPGESFPWPNISLDYPIVPGVEAGLELRIKGGLGASLQGTIAKQAAQDWNLGINPEINGFLEVGLKAKAGVGSAYIAAIQAFVAGGCRADFRGGLKLNGALKYDEQTQIVDASKLTSEYYANADFKAEISAGVQAQALYFFTKDLYRIRAKCSLGAGKLEGELKFSNGELTIGSPKFSGVIAGSFDKTSIKLEEQSYELIAPEKAEAILKDAAQKIAGSGEKRKDIINAVKAGYIRSLNETKAVIDKETAKSKKYVKKLENIDMRLARYHDLIEFAKQTEQGEDLLDRQEAEITKELESAEAKLNNELNAEIETLVDADKSKKEKSESKHGIFDKAKRVTKSIKQAKDNLKDRIIPEGLRVKYNAIEEAYKNKKAKAKASIQKRRDEVRIKYTDFKEEKKKSFSTMKLKAIENFPQVADKALEIKSEASNLKKKASDWKNRAKESIKEKTLIKLTELGIKDSQSFVKRVEKLTDMQIKYSKKHELHSNFLKSAIEAKSKAEKVLEDVEAAIANLQQLEEGTSMSKLSEMTEQEKAFMNAKNELHKDEVNLEDDFMKEIDDIEKEVAAALG